MPSEKNAGVKDNTKSHKPAPFQVKKAKYGFHTGKNLSKTETFGTRK